MKRERHYSGETQRVLRLFGDLLVDARRRQRRTQSDLAERAGVSKVTVIRAEHGYPGTEWGTVLELATLLGIRLFPDVDESDLTRRLAVIPGPYERRQDDSDEAEF